MLFRSDRKSTRLNSSHTIISYAVFCLKKKKDTEKGLGLRLFPSCGMVDQAATRVTSTAPSTALPQSSLNRSPAADPPVFFFLSAGRTRNFPPFPHPPPFRS